MADQESKQGTVTVVFSDLEGSTDLRTRLGDDAAQEIVRVHESLTREEIARCHGEQAKALGDGFMVSFGSARGALNYAVSLQRLIDQHNRANSDKAFRIRIGLNTGEVTTEREDIYGTAVNAAARICDKAQGGQILIPNVVKELAGFIPDLRIVDRGLFWLKGFPKRWRLFEVMWREKGAPREEPGAGPVRVRKVADVAPLPREQAPVVGRVAELSAIRDELDRTTKVPSLCSVSLEGEAGIGKTRLLESATDTAAAQGFGVLRIAADEELRGPFFLSRTLFALPAIEAIAEEASALESLERARDAISGRDPAASGLSPQEHMLRIFDEGTSAIRNLAAAQPLAILIDDVQWADEDSLKMIRYLVRTLSTAPIFLLATLRARAETNGSGAENLLADLERMRIAKRLRLGRFSRAESAELLENLLGGPVARQATESLHARAEGVPFFIEEFARTYRDAGVLQNVGGTWTLAAAAGPEVPASVQTLIERRLTQLQPDARSLLADASVLGRRFRLDDLAGVSSTMGASETQPWQMAEVLEPAVDLGIIGEASEGSTHDYAFTHDQIRAALSSSISKPRRRAIHGAVAEMLSRADDETNFTALAYHALQAGDEKLGVECSIKAARSTLESHAPEESVRIIDEARASASAPEIRGELLKIKDDALSALERSEDRAANLAEMAALASAIGDPSFEMDVKLRRASTARMSDDFESAIDTAGQVRKAAEAAGDRSMELDACLEMGQALMRSPLGETYTPLQEVDLDRAEEPFRRAAEIAREIDDKSKLAAALREVGGIELGRARMRALDVVNEPGQRLVQEVFFDPEVQRRIELAKELLTDALRMYEDIGDERGRMSSLIALAYAHITDFTRRGEAGRLEQIRRLRYGMSRMTTDSRKAREEAETLYSIHVFARSHLIHDLALARGREAFDAARGLGDRWLEFLSAGGIGLTHLALNQPEEATAWLDRAAHAAMAAPAPAVSRRLEAWRGLLAATNRDADAMTTHLERAVTLAIEQGRPAGECEALALLALESAKLGALTSNERLLDRAKVAAEETRRVAATLPGVLPWTAEAWAATSLVSIVRGDAESAAEAARNALDSLQPRLLHAVYVDVLWIAAKALISTGAPEAVDLKAEIQETLFFTEQAIVDPEVKRLWIEVPIHAELAELTGFEGFRTVPGEEAYLPAGLEEIELEMLKEMSSGKSDAELAVQFDRSDSDVERSVESIFSKLGVSTRNEAAEYALREGII